MILNTQKIDGSFFAFTPICDCKARLITVKFIYDSLCNVYLHGKL